MASGKKRVKSHRSPDWKPKVDPAQTQRAKAEEKVARLKAFPIWGTAFFGADLGLVVVGGVVSILTAILAGMGHWMVLRKREIPTENQVFYCLLILIGSWALWFVLSLAYQVLFVR